MREPWNELALPDLYRSLAATGLVRRLLELARDEDLGPNGVDLTGAAMSGRGGLEARVVARGACVVAGLAAMDDLVEVFGGGVGIEPLNADGSRVEAGEAVAAVRGDAAAVVRIERTMLNLLGRLSGVASRTAEFVRAMGPTGALLYDTRKTTPGLRVLEKYAVRCGGGRCHRMGLYDAVMFKDNHIAGVPGDRLGEHLLGLVTRARAAGEAAFIEVEADSLDQLDAVLSMSPGVVDVVLLDNMPPVELVEAVARRDRLAPSLLLEASGGVSLETIGTIAQTGVDRISVGSLTTRAVGVDFGLDA